MYVGVLLGAIVLAGCSVNEESEEQVQVQVKEEITEEVANGQTVEVENLLDTEKEEVVTSLELIPEQKKEYYKQYEKIVQKVNSEYDKDLELGPLEEFKPEEWVTPEDFEQIATDMATMEFTSNAFGGDLVD